MQKIRVDQIVVGERFRQEYGEVEELANSIAEHGLLHPIVLDADNNLVAGGRRLAAINHLGWPEIPYTQLEDLSELQRREIELEENIQRKDMTWQEQVAITKAIDELKKEVHGDAVLDGKKSGWSMRKTAEFLGKGATRVRQDINLAEAMEVVPELAECKTKDEAEKKLGKILERVALEELMRRKAERTLDEDEQAVFKVGGAAYIVGNCITGMQEMSGDNADFIIAEVDPPYGIDLHSQKKGKMVDKSYNEISEEDYPKFIREVAGEVYRVLAPNAWCVWWYGPTHHNLVLNTLKYVGFEVDAIPAIWIKNQGQTNTPDRTFARGWEPFFLCRKGNPTMHKRGRLNVFQFVGVSHQKRIHTTERPLEMISDILNTLCMPGVGKVLVPFLGSGNTLRAAFRHGMGGIGWDIDGADTKTQFIKRLLEDVGGSVEPEE